MLKPTVGSSQRTAVMFSGPGWGWLLLVMISQSPMMTGGEEMPASTRSGLVAAFADHSSSRAICGRHACDEHKIYEGAHQTSKTCAIVEGVHFLKMGSTAAQKGAAYIALAHRAIAIDVALEEATSLHRKHILLALKDAGGNKGREVVKLREGLQAPIGIAW